MSFHSSHSGIHQDAAGSAEVPNTLREILRQSHLWPSTREIVCSAIRRMNLQERLKHARVLLTGAGSSAYAASAVAAAWPNALAVPTTDLLVDAERYLFDVGVMISLARSGDSPESASVVKHVRAVRPEILQLAIVCNEDGALSLSGLDELIILDPRTNDRSLVMTSAFSNLVLAGLILARPEAAAYVTKFSSCAAALLPDIDRVCHSAASHVQDRMMVLSSSPLLGWAREAGLKTLEMTAGRFAVVTETYLGLRHGPMSFVKSDTLVLCLLSSDPLRRLYEVDLIQELQAKRIGYLVGIAEPTESEGLFNEIIPAVAPNEDDALRTPLEIAGPQLLGYHLSMGIGLNPDNPSPDGIINRVVQGIRIYPTAP